MLADRQATCLPKYMERSAWLATAWRLGRSGSGWGIAVLRQDLVSGPGVRPAGL